jgi:hypothetical protein
VFHHSQIDQKKSEAIKGMEDENKEEEDVQGFIDMEI